MSDFKWYVIHVAAGSENRVASDLSVQFSKAGIAELLEDVLVLKKMVHATRRGNAVQQEERILPGYVLVRMISTPDALNTIRRAPRVIGMLGADLRSDPKPLSDADMENLLNQIDDSDGVGPVSGTAFEPGEIVRVTDGLFSGLEGVIEEVDVLRMRLKVSISIFGRPTPVDLDFVHVEKI